jgi:hypothetical protein
MEATEVSEDEGVACLGFVVGTLGEAQVPLPELVPGVGLEIGVLVVGAWLALAPVTVEDILASIDEATGFGHGGLVQLV